MIAIITRGEERPGHVNRVIITPLRIRLYFRLDAWTDLRRRGLGAWKLNRWGSEYAASDGQHSDVRVPAIILTRRWAFGPLVLQIGPDHNPDRPPEPLWRLARTGAGS